MLGVVGTTPYNYAGSIVNHAGLLIFCIIDKVIHRIRG